MKNPIIVYQYTKWDGEKNVIRGWATEEAIKVFEAVKITDQFKEIDESLLDENGKLKEL
jgi:hypothetical protein